MESNLHTAAETSVFRSQFLAEDFLPTIDHYLDQFTASS